MTTATNLYDSSLGGFMEGMRWHDLAKPFFLGREKHAPAGFFLLTGGGKPTEGLYALWHHANTIGLAKAATFLLDWHNRTGSGNTLEVPAWVFLSPWLDQLAASTYSGATTDPESKHIWSFQNPFSRLPRLEKVGTYGKGDPSKIQEVLWQDVALYRFYRWDDMKDIAEGFYETFHQEILLRIYLKAQLLKNLVAKYRELLPARLFPERTYPAANDTALLEHGQLTAALAFVVGGNILLRQQSFKLTVTLSRDGDKVKVDGQEAENFSWDDYKTLTLQHLQGRLVRISFSWYEELFERSIRLDDIHGVRNFLGSPGDKRLLDLFKENFHREIGALFGANQKVAAALSPLNDFPFDLVYLLPDALSEEKIKQAVKGAYDQAVNLLKGALQTEYGQDFRAIPDLLNQAPLGNGELQAQLQALAPFCFFGEINVPSNSSASLADALIRAKQALAEQGLQAYRNVWAAGKIDQDEANTRLADISSDPAAESCEVCGVHEVFAEFYQKYEEFLQTDERGARTMEKVIYTHKEEPERLCRSCLARRLWSHGTVQEAWLQEMLEGEEQGGKVLVRRQDRSSLPPPPKLLPSLTIAKDSDLPEDMGAAFVRHRGGRLQVYPTMAAAADGDGNLALLYLTHNWQQGILEEISQARVTVDALCCIVTIIQSWTDNYKNLGEEITNWSNLLRSGDKINLASAKDLCLKHPSLNPLKTWPNNLTWHPLHRLADLINKLDSSDPNKNPEKVRVALGDIIQNWDTFFKPYYSTSGNSDLERFEAALVAHVAGLTAKDVQAGFRDEALVARPHLARVLTRIRWINEFFQDLPKILVDEGGIRTLTLENAYPRLVVAVPATDLIRALRVLHYALAHNLFSSTLYGDEPPCPSAAACADEVARRRREELSMNLLTRILPPVLLGAVVVCKERQPLYHLLSSARRVTDYLALSSKPYPGILLGLTDWRQGFGAMTAEQARQVVTLDFSDLYCLLDNEALISQRPLTSLAQAVDGEWGQFPEFFEALLAIKQTRQGWPARVSNALREQHIFDAMVFLKTAAKA